MNKQLGFTLIEMLVVISIIGSLSSMVLASVSTARNRATDTKITQSLSQIQIEAEIYAPDFTNFCNKINKIITSINGQCSNNSFYWVSFAPLKKPDPGKVYMCLDSSSGVKKQVAQVCGLTCEPTACMPEV